MTTISFSWGAEATNIGSVLNSGDSDKYFSLPISTINTALNSLPANAIITNITLTTRFIADPKYDGSYKCAVGYGGSGSITKELNRVSNGSTGYWDSTISCSLNEIVSGRQLNTNLGSHITYNIWTDGGYGKKSYYVGTNAGTDPYLSVTYEISTYTINVVANNSSYGYTTGSGTYNSGTGVTISAHPNAGYKFASWNDGNTSATRTVTVSGDATYTAYFVPVYVIYDSIFSFKQWADTGLKSWSLMNISNVTDTGFTGTALADDAYTENSTPVMNVTAGKSYTVDFQAGYPPGFQLFVFYTDANGVWNGAIENLDLVSNGTSKTFTPTTNYIVIRCDIDGTGNVNTFSDFRIYPADCPYMSTTVPAAERTDVSAWSMPTPTRTGYKFTGWNTKPDGTGTTYTSSSSFPTSDLVLYSQWENDTYSVYFSGMGATNGSVSSITASGGSFVLPSNGFYKEVTVNWDANASDAVLSYNTSSLYCGFAGWTRNPSGGDVHQPGETVNYTPLEGSSSLTMYAVWNAAVFSYPTPTRTGYRFTGWNTKADGSGTAYTSGSVSTLENLTLYAQWQKLEPKFRSFEIIRSTDLALVTINTPVEAGAKYIISVEVT